ncbi:hypothetical protein IMZ08_15580 [Bacillus luteolus]|uniref:Uncharacterized protein n=1 Tax=Litchfieldia luteola TaxID=682179 RepID=A0ABR9QLU2_9BACI|nr:hypothetical protein [Cytobacillus luteolus]MBE4909471.1 hypothetical protein [Cytobacillus luteolus]MBP1940872.1 hypothetical protein [Cytobacillus luteolus]
MYRLVSFFVIFTFVSIMIFFHYQYGHHSAFGHAQSHHEETVEIPISYRLPAITASITQDQSGSWLLEIMTSNFTFTPKKTGSTVIQYNEGHAHLYINGKKINRLYGNYYNLGNLSPGTYAVKVTLNANNHGIYTSAGKEIAFQQIIHVK